MKFPIFQLLRHSVVALLTTLFLNCSGAIAKADSPLTSTDIASAYSDVPAVNLAKTSGLVEPVMAALSDPALSQELRAAIVNAIGWRIEGQDNAQRYLAYIANRRQQPLSTLQITDLSAQETFALGYLLALDDYFTLAAIGGPAPLERLDALTLLRTAVLKDPTNFTVVLVHSLAQAQLLVAEPSRWCDIYQLVAAVNDNFAGERQLRPEAVNNVMSYISLYQDECR